MLLLDGMIFQTRYGQTLLINFGKKWTTVERIFQIQQHILLMIGRIYNGHNYKSWFGKN